MYRDQSITSVSHFTKPGFDIYLLAMVHGMRKLPHYFLSHTVIVLTQLPLKSLLRSVDYTGRVTKWSMILGIFDIKYMSCTSVKGQVLANLIVEFAETPLEDKLEEQNMDGKSVDVISLTKALILGGLC